MQQLRGSYADGVLNRVANWHPAVQATLGSLGLFTVTTLGPTGVAPFIYYRF